MYLKGSNLRVWNLRSFDPSDADKSSRPPYEDIANTQDTKNIVPSYAFGGTYEFAIVRIDAPKEANRDAFYMPEKVCEEDNGLRRRRFILIYSNLVGRYLNIIFNFQDDARSREHTKYTRRKSYSYSLHGESHLN